MPGSVSIFRRVVAWLVDYLAVMIPGMIVVLLAMAQLVHGLPGFVGGVATEMGWGYLVGRIFHTGTGGTSPFSGEWISFALPLIVALLLVPLLQFVYQAVMLSWRGRTFGKMLLDTRVSASTSDTERPSRGAAVRRAFLTTTLETGVVALALVLLTIGQLFLGILLWAAAIVAFWINAFSIFASRRRTIVDRLSGTAVVPRGLYAELATAARAALPTRRASPTPDQPAALTPGAPPHLALPPAPAQPFAATDFAIPHTATPPRVPAAFDTPTPPSFTASGPESGFGAGTDPAEDGRRSASETARVASRKASDAAIAAGRATADAAAVAGQLAKEGAETVIRSAPMQQALNSRAGQQAQALGAAGAEKARELGTAGAEQARKLRGKAQEMWRQRRSNRTDPDSDTSG